MKKPKLHRPPTTERIARLWKSLDRGKPIGTVDEWAHIATMCSMRLEATARRYQSLRHAVAAFVGGQKIICAASDEMENSLRAITNDEKTPG